ncbi:MAG: M1 family peptidase, partial [Flavobacteriaceae bacterium]
MKHHLLLYWVFLAVFSSGFAQQGVDFISGTIDITVDPYKEFIKGSVGYTFETSLKGDSIVIDARDLTITSVKINGKKTDHNYDGKQLMVYKKYRANKSYRLKIVYEAYPKKAVYFLGWDDKIPGNNQVWTQGQGKYSSHWVPSFDDMSEKLVFDLQIAFNKEYELAANGQLVGTGIQDSIKTWKYSMKDPMSSYLLAFAAGSYQSEIIHSSSGIPIQQFYYTDRAEVLEPTYRYTKEIMDFLEDEI